MATDRNTALRTAEKLLRQGRLDQAIAAYLRLVETDPLDLTTANALGDLYLRAGHIEQAVRQYARIAAHLERDGFLQKAAALYKKILRADPDNEEALLRSADIAARQGLLVDASAALDIVAARRAARGDRAGADEVRTRLSALDRGGLDSRLRLNGEVRERAERREAGAPNRVREPAGRAEASMGEILTTARPASVVSGHEAAGAPDLERVFGGLREQENSAPDVRAARAQYDEALACEADGREDDAATLFETAARSPHLRFEAAGRLARLLARRAHWSQAAEWFERAAAVPPPTIEGGRELMYDMACTLERGGENARALAVYLALQSDAGRYRDVADRIDRLSTSEIRG